MDNKYHAISCHFYDELEVLAVKKIIAKITYFVGDTMVDMQTAVNAKMIGIGVLWGFRDEEELMENGATFIVKHPLDILEIINHK